MKILKTIILSIISILCIGVIVYFEIKSKPVGSSIAGLILGVVIPELTNSIQDLSDTTNWKASQRSLKRAKLIKDNTIIRISFAYLYRIKGDRKYFLVKNERGTGKYQPVGGVYKLTNSEKIELKNRFQIKDDDKISIDKSSRNDYRLRIESKYLRKFVKRFNKNSDREHIDDLSREFKEELIDTGILNWEKITYRFCGRHMTEVKFSEHFQIYELLLADIVELIPTPEQEDDLKKLMHQHSSKYIFATVDEIMSLGINPPNSKLKEIIGDHTKKIIQESEGELKKIPGVGKEYTVEISHE